MSADSTATYSGKRLFDIVVSILVLLVVGPVILVFAFLVWLDDKGTPFYVSERVGLHGVSFRMIKLRSMRIVSTMADVTSTKADDVRITKIGHIIRKIKLDELTQFVNVLRGEMSLVGPRPNTRKNGVELYTTEELKLLHAKPGITDFSSIVFSDEGDILKGFDDADREYNRLIRPWKSRLGLLYVSSMSLRLDFTICFATFKSLYNRKSALSIVSEELKNMDAAASIVRVALRQDPLEATLPPGS